MRRHKKQRQGELPAVCSPAFEGYLALVKRIPRNPRMLICDLTRQEKEQEGARSVLDARVRVKSNAKFRRYMMFDRVWPTQEAGVYEYRGPGPRFAGRW